MNPRSESFLPTMILAANLARGTPIALLTNGIVLEARGLTSRTYISSFLMAYCTFINPLTFSSFARAYVHRLSSSTNSSVRVYGGRTQALSPECIPASSICSIIPPTTVISPSDIASTSTSMASSRYLSIKTGCSGDASTASRMYRSSDVSL